jgi:hypothetical protein
MSSQIINAVIERKKQLGDQYLAVNNLHVKVTVFGLDIAVLTDEIKELDNFDRNQLYFNNIERIKLNQMISLLEHMRNNLIMVKTMQ